MPNIKAIIVDDSAFMRKSLSIILGSDPGIDIVATGRDGIEGIALVKQYKPDIVTLDIEMPRMDGLTALKKIMAECPTSVIMVSSLTTEGAESTLKALELGAVDFIPKEMSYVSVNIINIKEDLIRKVKTIVREKALRNRLARIQRAGGAEQAAPKRSTSLILPKIGYKTIAMGISTGGPLSLQKIIPMLKGSIRIPIFIVQHMPPKFTQSLAERLNGLSPLKVKEAEHGEIVEGGTVYIAPGGFHMKVKRSLRGEIIIDISDQPSDSLHKPSVDVMIKSVFEIYGKHTMGVIMTGMGRDGLEGIKDIKSAGGYCIAQNEETCVVYGMPKAIVDAGIADVIAPLEKIPDIINMAV